MTTERERLADKIKSGESHASWNQNYHWFTQDEIDTIIAALREHVVPGGMVLVPTEPTREMKKAGETGWCEHTNRFLPERAGDCYRAMLAVHDQRTEAATTCGTGPDGHRSTGKDATHPDGQVGTHDDPSLPALPSRAGDWQIDVVVLEERERKLSPAQAVKGIYADEPIKPGGEPK